MPVSPFSTFQDTSNGLAVCCSRLTDHPHSYITYAIACL